MEGDERGIVLACAIPVVIFAFSSSASFSILWVVNWRLYRCLTEDEIAALHTAVGSTDFNFTNFPEDNWQLADSSSRVDEWDSDPSDVDLYDRDDVDWDGQYSGGRK